MARPTGRLPMGRPADLEVGRYAGRFHETGANGVSRPTADLVARDRHPLDTGARAEAVSEGERGGCERAARTRGDC